MLTIPEILVIVMICFLVFAVLKQAIAPSAREDFVEGHEFEVLNLADVMEKDDRRL